MTSTRFYLDVRCRRADGTCPLRIRITRARVSRYVNVGINLTPEQWDAAQRQVVKRPDAAAVNVLVTDIRQEVERALLEIGREKTAAALTVDEIKDIIESRLRPDAAGEAARRSFAWNFRRFRDTHRGRTHDIYQATYVHLEKFAGKSLETLTFEDITRDWLTGFDNYLRRTSPAANARNIHFRNIRAVFNDAIDNEITTAYPFRKFRIRPQETPKRSLSAAQLRSIFNAPDELCPRRWRDLFKLSFLLCGINPADLYTLKDSGVGRAEYYRHKTHKFYSVKIEPEAAAIIERYRGKKTLLDIADKQASAHNFNMQLNKHLQGIMPKITSYWARHSWATIAAELDIPKETIAAALGHEIGNSTTSIYIRYDQKKVDEANRKVIDFVLYNRQ